MKNICMLVQNYYDIDPRARREAESLVEAGYGVDVLALRMVNRESVYRLNGVNVITLNLPKKRGGKVRYLLEYVLFWGWAFLNVSIRMVKNKYRVIHINTLPDFLVFAGLVAKLMGARIVLDMHEIMPEFFMSKYGVLESHWMIRLLKWQEALSVRFADEIITINEPITEHLRVRVGGLDHVTVVMNSTDPALFSQQSDVENEQQPRHTDTFVFMYHGTLTAMYGLDIALRGFASASSKIDNAEFWVVGDGPERLLLERLADSLMITDRVTFFGSLPQHDIPPLIRQCSAGVLATRQDQFLDLSFSNKLPEYIVMGKPVIASSLKTIQYYFDESAVLFFEPNNSADLAQKMIALYNKDSEDVQLLVKNAQSQYQYINWPIMKKRYQHLIDTLAR